MENLLKFNKKEVFEMLTEAQGAEYTNRLIPGDEEFEYPEWSETAKIDGQEVEVFYRTTPEDEKYAEATDWSGIDWSTKITHIEKDGEIIWKDA